MNWGLTGCFQDLAAVEDKLREESQELGYIPNSLGNRTLTREKAVCFGN